jgi:excisionase family DNA binding protein
MTADDFLSERERHRDAASGSPGSASIEALRLSQPLPELLTAAETIGYLRLDTDDRDPAERLRNLVRRQRLPCIRRGRLFLFRKSAVDAWLDGARTRNPARLNNV